MAATAGVCGHGSRRRFAPPHHEGWDGYVASAGAARYVCGMRDQTHFGCRDVPLTDKQALVDDVFDKVARRYDLMNDLMSDRKSTRLNSSHMSISYSVFCLKKK